MRSVTPSFVVSSLLSVVLHAGVLLLYLALSARLDRPEESVGTRLVDGNALAVQLIKAVEVQAFRMPESVMQETVVQEAVVATKRNVTEVRREGRHQPDASSQVVAETRGVATQTGRLSQAGKQGVSGEQTGLSAKSEPWLTETHYTGNDKMERSLSVIETVAAVSQTAEAVRQLSGQRRQQLLMLLHRQISARQQYPFQARRLRREGTATVGFLMTPEGRLVNLTLLKSSRTGALDQAALSAVESIAPFAAAADYLQQPEQFQVDVIFQLM